MNISLTGHKSQAIRGCILRVVATKAGSPDIYKSSFLRDCGDLELGRQKAWRWQLPASRVFAEDCSHPLCVCVSEREAWLTGHSYEGKLRGFLYRRIGTFDSLAASLLFPEVRQLRRLDLWQSCGTRECKLCCPPEPGNQGIPLGGNCKKQGTRRVLKLFLDASDLAWKIAPSRPCTCVKLDACLLGWSFKINKLTCCTESLGMF